jgi:hypothetical protein
MSTSNLLVLILSLSTRFNLSAQDFKCVDRNIPFNETALPATGFVKDHIVEPIELIKQDIEFRFYQYSVYANRGSIFIVEADSGTCKLIKIEYWYNRFFIGEGWNQVGETVNGLKIFVKKSFSEYNSLCSLVNALKSNDFFLMTPDLSVPLGQQNKNDLWFEIKYFNKFRSLRYPPGDDENDQVSINNINKIFSVLFRQASWRQVR